MTAHDTGLMIPRRLESWIAEYQVKVAAIPEALEAFDRAAQAVKAAACVGGQWGEETIDTGRGIGTHFMERSLRKSAWLHFIAELNLNAVMSAADKLRVKQMLADPLPFDADSLRAVFGDHIANPRAAILRGLAEVFAGLDPAYKSHEKVKIGVKGLPKRVIIGPLNGYGGGWGWDKVRDIINALAAYQNKPLVSNADMAALREDGEAMRDSKEVLDPYESDHFHWKRAARGAPPKTIRTVGRGIWLKTFQIGKGQLLQQGGRHDDQGRDDDRGGGQYDDGCGGGGYSGIHNNDDIPL